MRQATPSSTTRLRRQPRRSSRQGGYLADIDEDVRRAFSSGRLSRHAAQTLRGRITFARAQLFGRCSAPAFCALGAVADRTRVSPDDVARALEAFVSLVRLLQCARAREGLAHLPSPWLLCSDGACELARTGFSGISVGAILLSPGGVAQFFGLEVPRWFMDEIGLAGQMQVVGQAELLPILLARNTWRTNLRNAALISFVDNDAASHAVVSGSSPSLASSRIISELACMDSKLNILSLDKRVYPRRAT